MEHEDEYFKLMVKVVVELAKSLSILDQSFPSTPYAYYFLVQQFNNVNKNELNKLVALNC